MATTRRFNINMPSMLFLAALQLMIAAAAAAASASNNRPSQQGPRRILMKQELTFGLILEEVEHAPTADHPDGYSEERWVAKLPQVAKDLLNADVDYMELIDMNNRLINVQSIERTVADGSKMAKLTSGLSTLTSSETIADVDTGLIFIPSTAKVRVDSNSVDNDAQSRSLLRKGNGGGNSGSSNHRRLADKKGELKTIVIRVSDKNGVGPAASAADLEGSVFTDDVCMKTQYEACSHGKLTIKPHGGSGEHTGVYDLELPDLEIAPDGSTSRTALQNHAMQEARKQIDGLDEEYDLTLFCMPPGTSGGWLAYAFVNSQYSFYNDDWCTYVSAQVHEVGHNLGLAHSGEGTADYGDTSGMMGFSFKEEDTLMCFNAAKNYQLEWYANKVKNVDPLSSNGGNGLSNKRVKEFVLNGVADYGTLSDLIVLRLKETDVDQQDYYIGYNREHGINSDTKESQDEVTVVLKQAGEPFEYGQSWKVASLALGASHTIPNYNGKAGRDVRIKFVKALDGRATIEVRDVMKAPVEEEENDAPCVPYSVKIFTDNYPDDQSWQIIAGDGTHLATGPAYTDPLTLHETVVCLPYAESDDDDDCHDFVLRDKYGDGICCGQGRGYYTVSRKKDNGDETEVVAGGWGVDSDNFKEKSHAVCVGPKPAGDGGEDDDLPVCTDKSGRTTFINTNGDKKKWSCKNIKKKNKCKLVDTKGLYLWESCPVKCAGKYDESLLKTDRYEPCEMP